MRADGHLVRLHVVIPGVVSLFPALIGGLVSSSPFSILDFTLTWLVFFVAINLLFLVTNAVALLRVGRRSDES